MASLHTWLDVLGLVATLSGGLIATLVGLKLSRSEAERQNIQNTLQNHGERITAVETITDLVKRNLGFK